MARLIKPTYVHSPLGGFRPVKFTARALGVDAKPLGTREFLKGQSSFQDGRLYPLHLDLRGMMGVAPQASLTVVRNESSPRFTVQASTKPSSGTVLALGVPAFSTAFTRSAGLTIGYDADGVIVQHGMEVPLSITAMGNGARMQNIAAGAVYRLPSDVNEFGLSARVPGKAATVTMVHVLLAAREDRIASAERTFAFDLGDVAPAPVTVQAQPVRQLPPARALQLAPVAERDIDDITRHMTLQLDVRAHNLRAFHLLDEALRDFTRNPPAEMDSRVVVLDRLEMLGHIPRKIVNDVLVYTDADHRVLRVQLNNYASHRNLQYDLLQVSGASWDAEQRSLPMHYQPARGQGRWSYSVPAVRGGDRGLIDAEQVLSTQLRLWESM